MLVSIGRSGTTRSAKPEQHRGSSDRPKTKTRCFGLWPNSCEHSVTIPPWQSCGYSGGGGQGFPFDASIVERRFGTKAEQVARLHSWCNAQSGFEDVAEICAPEPDTGERSSEPDDLTDIKTGYVYLLRSKTRGYKIGMTSSMPRRWAEIENADPEEVELVHHFKTVDSAGIEAYWHRRFDAQRKGRGEWFSLSNAHVAEFKRRSKSM